MTRRRTRILAADIGGGHAIGAATMLVRRRADRPLDAEPLQGTARAALATRAAWRWQHLPAQDTVNRSTNWLLGPSAERQRRLGALLSLKNWVESTAQGNETKAGEAVRVRGGKRT